MTRVEFRSYASPPKRIEVSFWYIKGGKGIVLVQVMSEGSFYTVHSSCILYYLDPNTKLLSMKNWRTKLS